MEELDTLNSNEITKEDAKFLNETYNDVRQNKHPNIVKRLKKINEKNQRDKQLPKTTLTKTSTTAWEHTLTISFRSSHRGAELAPGNVT